MTVPLRAALYLPGLNGAAGRARYLHSRPAPPGRSLLQPRAATSSSRPMSSRVRPRRTTAGRVPADDRSRIGESPPRSTSWSSISFSRFFRDQFSSSSSMSASSPRTASKLVSITQEIGDDPNARHDAPDDGAVRRVPSPRRTASTRSGRMKEKRPPRLLERLPSSDRLSRRRSRAARRQGQEEARNRPAAR